MDLGSGSSPIPVSATLTGLQRDATYHYRVVAESEAGTTYGADMSFRTLPYCGGASQTCSWSLQSTPYPELRTEDVLEADSCPSSTVCVAVGNNRYSGKGLTEFWNGTEWKRGALSTEVKDVSCPTALCLAIAKSGATVWRFKWLEWKAQWIVEGAGSLSLPADALGVTLKGISCFSETACTIVGSYQLEGSVRTFAERWNGTAWTQQTPPAPSEGSASRALLEVSCATETSCFAVGTAAGKPFAERWNGSEWSISPPSAPTGSVEATLEGVSCPTASSCTAVGGFRESSGGAEKAFSARWNGSEWSTVVPSAPGEIAGSVRLRSVSCLSASSCFAVGSYVTKAEGKLVLEERTLAEAWDGSSWSLQAPLNPSGEALSSFNAISCASAIACTAVGSAQPGSSANDMVTLAEHYG